MTQSLRPAIFLDRDGTLNHSVGYVNHPSRFRLFPWTFEAIRLAKEQGHLAVVVTNQSGLGRGYISKATLDEVHRELEETLEAAGAPLDGIYSCPHTPSDNCDCRKPKPGLLLRAAEELSVDLSRSWMIGDTYTDLEAAWAVEAKGALVRTGFGRGTLETESGRWPRQPDVVSEDLHRALCTIFFGAVA
jgi:D,D-heptose 1,7-bisphosphate phosphatase